MPSSSSSSGVAFATPGVLRVFLRCMGCGRTMPHYHVYAKKGHGQCRCGGSMYRPTTLPEWQAAWWLLVVGWLWRKTIQRRPDWDPRMPIRER